ncbi:DUF1853 family protein [Aquimarina sp. ERC-38]|uniref:DUF1853 family protein n=1 Tax=Aquimarina sp. ERC-38 TaxID=2949996 RepID=UPI002245DFE9|nr:DUF1853 family protein [Aquimarina sp. ERC-38]UZO80315.1 DUF1853 family protein [Aquimarina sp. ERC-38]
MSLLKQYLGFLQSHILWKNSKLFGLIAFDPKLSIDKLDNIVHVEIPNFEVLGKRIESFFADYLEHSNDFDILAKNIQIFSGTTTIGEIDFLLKERMTGQRIHVELVYKFYLYNPALSNDQLKCWVGPNKRDHLLKKIKKITEKQLPLLYTEEAIFKLKTEYDLLVDGFDQQVCYFANLFLPLSVSKEELKYINPDCIEGFWIRKIDFTVANFGKNQYKIPDKADWIIAPASNPDWQSFEKVLSQIDTYLLNEYAPLIWLKTPDGEFQKFFIVWW